MAADSADVARSRARTGASGRRHSRGQPNWPPPSTSRVDANIAHGALHPRDVLVSSDDARLTGIGIAQVLERVGVATPVRRPYTAPERAAGAAWDRRADVFSLAAIVHELLWGRRIAAIGQQAAAALTPLDGADLGALRRLFGQALAEDPADRFDSATEFSEGLRGRCGGRSCVEQCEPGSSAGRLPASLSARRLKRGRVEPRLPLDGDADRRRPAQSDSMRRYSTALDERTDRRSTARRQAAEFTESTRRVRRCRRGHASPGDTRPDRRAGARARSRGSATSVTRIPRPRSCNAPRGGFALVVRRPRRRRWNGRVRPSGR